MRMQLRPWHLGVGAAAVCALTLGTLSYVRSRGVSTPGAMLACLPRTGNVTVYLDVRSLRQSGMLDMIVGSKATEDLEYRQFVDGTGFDYRRDIDAIAASFSGRNSYLVLSGRFDWKKLNAYAAAQDGNCRNSVCRVPASGGRFVSFYPMRSSAMAIAFSYDNSAVLDIAPRSAPEDAAEPDQPIWISVGGPALRDVPALPAGAKSFVSPLESAEAIVLSIGPSDGQLRMNLNVLCASETAASDLVVKLEGATNMLRKMLEREKQRPNPGDLSGLLVAGSFRREQRRVAGAWPMHREFIQSLASGSLN